MVSQSQLPMKLLEKLQDNRTNLTGNIGEMHNNNETDKMIVPLLDYGAP